MSTLTKISFGLFLAVALVGPGLALADTPWWCNSSFGAWWGVQNCSTNNGTGGVLVYVSVINRPATNVLGPADFTVSVSGTPATPATFPGSLNGSPVVLAPGAYAVVVPDTRGYTATYSQGCSGTIMGGQYR